MHVRYVFYNYTGKKSHTIPLANQVIRQFALNR